MLSWEKTSKTSKKLVRFVYRGVDEEDGEGILANSIIDHLYFANMFNILPWLTLHDLQTGYWLLAVGEITSLKQCSVQVTSWSN